MKTISAGDANRHFSALLRDVSRGEQVVILSRGKSVATMNPVLAGHRHLLARRALLQRLRMQQPQELPSWTRDELYAR
jgi:antitoxin (DNA-binding transcriptional repressor) of toxin-antitoxin stability system